MERDDLEKLSKQQLVDLVLKLQRPAKTSRTSSKPPSTDKKARREHAKPGGAKTGHEGHSRALHENPDETVDHRPDFCPECHGQLNADLSGDVIGEYDEVEVPPIKLFVRRHRRLCVCCPHCSSRVKAPLPIAAQGSPFGPRLHGLALYLKTFQAISFARLEGMLSDLFGVKISQGALNNMLKRSHASFTTQRAAIIKDLRHATMVASDETGIRIEGLNGYHWVFMSNQAIVHEAQLSRAAQVVRDIMDDHRPKIWLSDAYSAQQGHGHHHQTCLAHLARDVAYALEASDDMVPLRLKLWLDKVFALARNITSFAASTLKAKKRELENTLADILSSSPACEIAETIRAKLARASPRLLTFIDYPGEVEVTNNACERALRPAVSQRKVTNGLRSMWAAQGDCAVRTVVDTGKLSGNSPFQTILTTIS
ncbi:MAG: IS66 family transposase [Gammaproteobacteria bacterium]|nr:IS66 family transposase [Gammaproteobacteria bacterium]